MISNNKFSAAGAVAQELSAQEVTEEQSAGGLWTVPTTSTIGYVCTVSAECNHGVRCDFWS